MSNVRVLAGGFLFLLALPTLNASSLLIEGFDNISTLSGSGWTQVNNSTAPALTGWFQGNTAVFNAQSGPADSYIGANFDNAAFAGNISNWLITPVLSLQNDLQFTFYTRTEAGLNPADSLELRLSTNGASGDVGATAASVGDFTSLLVSINPALSSGGYPTDWTLVSVNFTGTGVASTGRFAFRYAVLDTSTNADYIGIDSVSVTSTDSAGSVPEPATIGLLALGLGAAVLRRQAGRGARV